jgi:hypothetical protein
MRINVSDVEMTGEMVRVTKTASGTGKTFVGLRLYLASSPLLHDAHGDDDRSAVTFWFEQGNAQEEHVVRQAINDLSRI